MSSWFMIYNPWQIWLSLQEQSHVSILKLWGGIFFTSEVDKDKVNGDNYGKKAPEAQ